MEDNLSKIVSEFIGSSEELKKDVIEAARVGIKKEITEYFTGYSSPFRKQVQEYLQKNIPMARFSLPSYAEIVNKEIIAEIDKMAAQTCISTFCKSFRKVLSGIPTEEDGTVKLSRLLDKVYDNCEFSQYGDGITLEFDDDQEYGAFIRDGVLTIIEDGEERKLDICLMKVEAKISENRYNVFRIPNQGSSYGRTAKSILIKEKDRTIEIPSYDSVFSDMAALPFASCVILNIPIIIDVNDYNRDFIED